MEEDEDGVALLTPESLTSTADNLTLILSRKEWDDFYQGDDCDSSVRLKE